MSETNPRVLLVSASPLDAATGTGTTLRALFSEWPRQNLAQIHYDPLGSEPTVRCYQHSMAGGNWFLRAASKARRRASTAGSTSRPVVDVSVPLSRRTWESTARRWCSAGLDLLGGGTSPELLGFAEDFRPDVIYTLLGSASVTRTAMGLQDSLGVPLVVHFMDDWLSTRYANGEWGGLADRALQTMVRAAVTSPGGSLAISPQMAEEYGRRFRRDFGVAGNYVSDEQFGEPRDGSEESLSLVYLGGLHLGRGETLIKLADALVRSASGILRVFAPERDLAAYPRLSDHPAVVETRNASAGEMPGILAKSDMAVHVESFDEETCRFTRLSLSTKIPMYMAAGRPILAVCREDLASGQYVERSGCGIRCDASPDALARTLATLSDPAVRRQMSLVGLDVARSRHSQASTTMALLEAFGWVQTTDK